jgi:hypothetical protein
VKQLLLSILVIGLVGGLAAGGLFAHLMDTETSQESVFEAGEWYTNLQIDVGPDIYDDDAPPGGPGGEIDGPFPLFGTVEDIKPCYSGQKVVSIHLQDSSRVTDDLYILLRGIDMNPDPEVEELVYVTDEVSLHEPEEAEGDSPDDPADYQDGELDQYLQLEFWLEDADHNWLMDIWTGYPANLVYNADMEGWPITDPSNPIVLDPDFVYYVGIRWHLMQNPGVNIVMGDRLSFVVAFGINWIP